MIQIIKISLLMVISMAVLVACSDSDQMLTNPDARNLNQPAREVQAQLNYLPAGMENTQVKPLLANGNVEAGYIFLANDNQNLYVSYYLFNGWQLSETRLSVARNIKQLPRDEYGNLLPDLFQYQSPLTRCETVSTQVIPLAEVNLKPGDDFVLASQALVADASSADRGPNICIPGAVDAQWMYVGQSKVRVELNAPDRMQRLNLEKVSDLEARS